ncbi:hypothetical protein AYO43_02485 [Nitrospira sp. SCGC AG-212-E16]|nr:hypothetical protein AYO43_02485 [Nitrospira sp. SCGC AG-212-E16]
MMPAMDRLVLGAITIHALFPMWRDLATIRTVAGERWRRNRVNWGNLVTIVGATMVHGPFIGKRFALRATDLSPNTIRMKPFVQGIETRPKTQPMQIVARGPAEAAVEL